MNWASSTYSFWSSAVPVFDDLPLWGLPLRDRWHIVDGSRHRYPIYLSEAPGGVRLSDRCDTLMRISYDHDIDAFLAGSRGLLIERILGEERVGQDGGVFSSRTSCFRRWPKNASAARPPASRSPERGGLSGRLPIGGKSSEDLRRKIERRVA